MRSDTQTINGLNAYQLSTTSSSSALSTTVGTDPAGHPGNANGTVYWGVRVWRRNSAGSETEITAGTPVAQVTRTSGSGIQSATWTPAATTLAITDSIIVRVYIRVVTSNEDTGWLQGGTLANFSTEQLGSIRLDAQQWTIYYNTSYYTLGSPPPSRYTSGTFYWGASSTDSRITNFTRSVPIITVGTTGTQKADTHASSSGVYIGGAFTFVADQSSSNVTSITVSNTGTVADTDLSNLYLYYKQEATCSTTVPVDATQFNSTAGSFSSGSSTVTGTMTVGTSQVCVYARLDVGSGVSIDETIEIEITDPSTEVSVSLGSVTPATAVAIGGTTYITAAGFLSVDIVDDTDETVSSPSVNFSSGTFRWTIQQTIATLGVTIQRLKVSNFTTSQEWNLSLAATGGSSASWQSGSDSYKYNGLESEGRLQVNPSLATITPSGTCSSTGLTKQSSAYFVSGSVDSVDLIVAGTSAETDCDWYVTGIGLVQDIPDQQAGGSYSLAMTITVI